MKRVALLLVPLCVGCLDRSAYEPRYAVFTELSEQGEKLEHLAISESWIWWTAQQGLFRASKDDGVVTSTDVAVGDEPPLLVEDERAFFVTDGTLWELTIDAAPTVVTVGVLGSGDDFSGFGNGAYAVTEDEEYLYYVAISCGGDCDNPAGCTALCPSSSPPPQPCVCSWSKTTGTHTLLTVGHPDWANEPNVQIVRSESALFFMHGDEDGYQLSTRQISAVGTTWDEDFELSPASVKFILGRASGGVYGAFQPGPSDNPGAGGIQQYQENRGEWEALADARGEVLSMTFGPDHLYWLAENDRDGGAFELSRVRLDGSPPESFGTFGEYDEFDESWSQSNQHRVVADETHVYWAIDSNRDQILRLAVDP